MRKPLANALDLDRRGGLRDTVPPDAGVALLIETARRRGVIAAAAGALPAQASPKGRRQGARLAALVLLSGLGGDCPAELDGVRREQGLAARTGYTLPAAATARQWLDRFHDPLTLTDRPAPGRLIPAETPGRAGRRVVVERSVLASVTALSPARTVPLAGDAQIVESGTREALPTDPGERGAQPLLVTWAETGLVLAAACRDGTVPASVTITALVARAAATLPARADGWQSQVRAASAAAAHAILDHWDERGWTFAVSAVIRSQLRAAVAALPEAVGPPWRAEGGGVVREWAAGASVPSRPREGKDQPPDRSVAIGRRQTAGRLFGDGPPIKHCAVLSNDWARAGPALLAGPRGTAGTLEQGNRLLTDERAGGVAPSGQFGATAAWRPLQVRTLNLRARLKAAGLDPAGRQARPKRRRFAVGTQFGRLVDHARLRIIRGVTAAIRTLRDRALGRLRRGPWPPT